MNNTSLDSVLNHKNPTKITGTKNVKLEEIKGSRLIYCQSTTKRCTRKWKKIIFFHGGVSRMSYGV